MQRCFGLLLLNLDERLAVEIQTLKCWGVRCSNHSVIVFRASEIPENADGTTLVSDRCQPVRPVCTARGFDGWYARSP